MEIGDNKRRIEEIGDLRVTQVEIRHGFTGIGDYSYQISVIFCKIMLVKSLWQMEFSKFLILLISFSISTSLHLWSLWSLSSFWSIWSLKSLCFFSPTIPWFGNTKLRCLTISVYTRSISSYWVPTLTMVNLLRRQLLHFPHFVNYYIA